MNGEWGGRSYMIGEELYGGEELEKLISQHVFRGIYLIFLIMEL